MDKGCACNNCVDPFEDDNSEVSYDEMVAAFKPLLAAWAEQINQPNAFLTALKKRV